MWIDGSHFRIEKIDRTRMTQDCGIVASFKQQSRATVTDRNVIGDELMYVGKLQEIIEVDYRCFSTVLFRVAWFKSIYRGPNATIRLERSGFYAVDSSRLVSSTEEPYIFPRHCEQCFFYTDGSEPTWLHVVHAKPRSKRIFQANSVLSMEDDLTPSTENEETSERDIVLPTDAMEEQQLAVDEDAENEDEIHEDDLDDVDDIHLTLDDVSPNSPSLDEVDVDIEDELLNANI